MNASRSKPPIAPFIPYLVGMLAISFAAILVRFTHASVSILGMYRMLFAIALMLPFGMKQMRSIRFLTYRDWIMLSLSGFFLFLHFQLWMLSLRYTSIASSTIILSLAPVFVMVGAYFAFRDRPAKIALIGMAIALFGIGLVGSGDSGVSRDAVSGDVMSFLGTIAVVINFLIAKRLMTRIPSFLFSMIAFGMTGLCFFFYNLIEGYELLAYPSRDWLVFMLMAIVPTMLGQMVFNWLLKYLKATTISMSVLAEPIGSSLFGMLIFQEILSAFQWIGGALVIFGLVLYMRSEKVPATEN